MHVEIGRDGRADCARECQVLGGAVLAGRFADDGAVGDDEGAVENAHRQDGHRQEELAALTDQISGIDPDRYPTIFRLAGTLTSGAAERADWGFDVLVDGILAASARQTDA